MRGVNGAEIDVTAESETGVEVEPARMIAEAPAPQTLLMVTLRCMLREAIEQANTVETPREARDHVALARDILKLLIELADAYEKHGLEEIGQ